MRIWRIFIDTGGTFTDGLAFNPEGELSRVKVLSDSSLRATIKRQVAANCLQIQHRWEMKPELLEGFYLAWNGQWETVAHITRFDPSASLLYLDRAVVVPELEANFFIHSQEEAPVLATRLLTETKLGEAFPPLEMRLGFTKGTNALLERKGAKVLLITNKGFEDLPLIRHQQRPDIFALHIDKPKPLIHQAIGISARMDAEGKVGETFDGPELHKLLQKVETKNEYSVAISLIHSYKNNKLEQEVAAHSSLDPFAFVCQSAELSKAVKWVDRMETALVEAYIGPLIQVYLQRIQSSLGGHRLSVMSSAGGLVEINDYRAKDSMLSGPAGGVVAAAYTAQCLGIEKLLTLDMGGTSTDVSRFDKRLDYRSYTQVGEIVIQSPGLMIETVAAGGGSICDFDGIQLTVGPESAGANPGPACYGAGGPLTLTDVNLLLGRVAPDLFGFPVHMDNAQAALEKVMAKMNEKQGINAENVLLGFLTIANEKMAEAIRKISIHKGFDPRNFALLAFGGAGGQHACGISDRLGISRIVAPYHAGLLSAEGMGIARLERFAMRQVLAKLKEVEAMLPTYFEALATEVQSALTATPGDDPITIEEQQVFMRLKGQENSLAIDFQQGHAVAARFQEAYTHLYHYWPEPAIIEVESIRLVGRKGSVAIRNIRTQQKAQKAIPQMHMQRKDIHLPVYNWSSLQEGVQMEGPALIVSPYATFCLDIGWSIHVQKQGCLLAEKVKEELKTDIIEDKTVRLSLFTHRFQALAEDMGALLERTAFSVNVKERLDFSCALLDTEGFLIANAPHIPVHLGSLGVCLRYVTAKYPLNPGDVIVTNHPAFGGSHLPDVTMMCAAFDDKGQKIGYLVNRAHHAEIGGKYPGSMPADAQYLEEEGVVIAPCYIMKGGKTNWSEISELLLNAQYPTRALEDNLADLSAALASLQSGKKALELLAQQYETVTLTYFMREIRRNTAQKIKHRLAAYVTQLPLEAEEYLDDGAQIRVALRAGKQKSFCFDFSGSASVHPGNFNATEAIVHSVVLYVLRLLVDEPIPLNEGLMDAIELILPHGMLNPPFDKLEKAPAVVGGNTELSQRLTDTLLKAFGLAACSQGTMNNTLFGNAHFGFYETLAGGVGAVKGYPGADATHQHMTNTRITDPEIMELRYPIRLEACAIRKNSGGKGKWKGGDGLIRKIRFLAPVSLTMLSQHRQVAPYGLAGGEPGLKGEQWLQYPDEEKALAMPGCFSCQVPKGTLLHIATPGGGGYGKISF